MTIKQPAMSAMTNLARKENREALDDAIRDYVEAHQRLHGQKRTAESLGVSRHTLWRYLEHGQTGRAVPAAVLDSVGGSVRDIEAATLEIIIDLEGLRPGPAMRPLRRRLEDALLLLCAAPLATVDELARFGRVPVSTLRERLDNLTKHGLMATVSHHLGALGSRPQRWYFPTEKGVTVAGTATQGNRHVLMAYPLSRQWFRLPSDQQRAAKTTAFDLQTNLTHPGLSLYRLNGHRAVRPARSGDYANCWTHHGVRWVSSVTQSYCLSLRNSSSGWGNLELRRDNSPPSIWNS